MRSPPDSRLGGNAEVELAVAAQPGLLQPDGSGAATRRGRSCCADPEPYGHTWVWLKMKELGQTAGFNPLVPFWYMNLVFSLLVPFRLYACF